MAASQSSAGLMRSVRKASCGSGCGTPGAELINPALDWLAAMDEAEFGRRFNGSPVRRAKFRGFRRNLAIAMGNSGEGRYLPLLAEWAADTDPSADPVAADAAQCAVKQLRRKLE